MSFEKLKETIKKSTILFVSNVAISLYTVSVTFILGLFTNNTIVGYYAAADKLIQVIKSLFGPVSQTMYPFLSKKVLESKLLVIKFIRTLTGIIFIATMFISAIVILFAKEIVTIALGNNYTESIMILKILAPTIFLIGLNSIFGTQTMLTFGKNKAFSAILIKCQYNKHYFFNIACS